jgi:23S rRNA (uracil1939-C5)-methyltransferase
MSGTAGGELVTIGRIATGGDGVGRLADGRTVFVPRTAPGDTLRLGQLRLHARYARARVAQVVEEGPGRVAPPCPHYTRDDCGGCQLQHLAMARQLELKRQIVADALERIGKLAVTVPPVVPSEADWHYRGRITLALGPGRRFAGFHPVDRPDKVFDLEHCHIAREPLMRLWQALRPHLTLLPPDSTSLVLREDREGDLHAIVRAAGKQAWGKGKSLHQRLTSAGVAATIWWHPEGGAPRVVAGEREAFPATVFEQVHPAMGDRIREHALQGLGDLSGVHAWDLYAGIGETTDRLFALGATVESIELDRRAVDFGERRWHAARHEPEASQRPEPAGVVRHVGKVEELVGRLRDPGAVIANPPRAGMEREVTRELLARGPSRIAYISCDPATLARDLDRLCHPSGGEGAGPGVGYRVVGVQPFDLFPQTAHVETVALLEAA